jgi:hypothetical protein
MWDVTNGISSAKPALQQEPEQARDRQEQAGAGSSSSRCRCACGASSSGAAQQLISSQLIDSASASNCRLQSLPITALQMV